MDQVKQTLEDEDETEAADILSSASCCINLCLPAVHVHTNNNNGNNNGNRHHHDAAFHPVYTHQCFHNEVIMGYQPFSSSQLQALVSSAPVRVVEPQVPKQQRQRQHSSFQYHQYATSFLQIIIQLTPSCDKCSIQIHTESITIAEANERGGARGDEEDETTTKGKKRKLSASDYLDRDNTIGKVQVLRCSSRHHCTTPTSSSATKILSIPEIIQGLSKALPTITRIDHYHYCDQEQQERMEGRQESDGETKTGGNRDGDDQNQIGVEIHLHKKIKKESVIHDFNSTSAATNDYLYLKQPIGLPLVEYKRKINGYNGDNGDKSTNGTFLMCLANGTDEEVSKYHTQVQKLSLWFIENADDVDLSSSEGGGEWKVLYLFRKHDGDYLHSDHNSESKSCKYSLVGFMTLFGFFSPFKKPKAGIVLRICQALILPPYQRSGHGKVFMNTVYKYAHGLYDETISSTLSSGSSGSNIASNNSGTTTKSMAYEIVEVNVEDPAPGCEALRNRIDYELFRENYKQFLEKDSRENNLTIPTSDTNHNPNLTAATDADNIVTVKKEMLFLPSKYYHEQFFDPIKESDAAKAAALARISKTQIHIAYEIYKLSSRNTIIHNLKKGILSSSSSLSSSSPLASLPLLTQEQVQTEIEEVEKKFRLMVKKRLNHFYSEDIGACETKDAKKKKLADIFEKTMKEYAKVLPS